MLDEGSGIATTAPAVVLKSEGANQLRSGDCTDRVCHITTASSGAISIDKSPPTRMAHLPRVRDGRQRRDRELDGDRQPLGDGRPDAGLRHAQDVKRRNVTASKKVLDRVRHKAVLTCTYRVDQPG